MYENATYDERLSLVENIGIAILREWVFDGSLDKGIHFELAKREATLDNIATHACVVTPILWKHTELSHVDAISVYGEYSPELVTKVCQFVQGALALPLSVMIQIEREIGKANANA